MKLFGEFAYAFLVACVVISLAFFVLFAFHATTPDQKHAKQFLDDTTATSPFVGNEHAHMQDVKNVLSWARIFAAMSVIGGLFALEKRTPNIMVASGTLLIALIVALAIIPWDALFTVFHQIFFPQGNWLFAWESHIIQTYPPTVFTWFAGVWGGMCIVGGSALIAVRNA